jgi:hypothetical protein
LCFLDACAKHSTVSSLAGRQCRWKVLPSPTATAAAVLNDVATTTTTAIANKIAAVTTAVAAGITIITVTIAVAVATVTVAVATVAAIKWVTVVTAVAAIEPATVIAAVIAAIESMTVIAAMVAIKSMTIVAAVIAIRPMTVVAALIAAIESMAVVATALRRGVSRSGGSECDSRSEYNGNSAQHQRHDTSAELVLRSNRTRLIVYDFRRQTTCETADLKRMQQDLPQFGLLPSQIGTGAF